MNQLDVALAARAFRAGQAVRSANFRHRHLLKDPLTLVLWQLGGEPFSAAAIGYGRRRQDLRLIVTGDPRNRDLAFAALMELAGWFNQRFELAAADREWIQKGSAETSQARTAPQVVVANEATVEMIGHLGRRLAYLPMDGPMPAPPELVRLGQHLLFLHRHSRTAGQQLIVSLTDLLAQHWATPLSAFESQSLAAFNAYISPQAGIHGFHAAVQSERDALGPMPAAADDQRLEPLVEQFNFQRGKRTDPATIRPLVVPIRNHYRPLVQRTWEQIWECFDREVSWPEASSVDRRWKADREAYTQHIDWTAQNGRTRTRQTARQAAVRLGKLEDAKTRLQAEEACEDPLKMIPYILLNKAVQGRVVRIDADHREKANVQMVRRPLVTILSLDPCLIPRGKELWWTGAADGRPYVVHEVRPDTGGGSIVTLKLTTSSRGTPLPAIRSQACFSIHTTKEAWFANLPPAEPWSHRPLAGEPALAPIEEGGRP